MMLQVNLPREDIQLKITDELSREDFEALCFSNPDLTIEREADGTVTVMTPVSTLGSDHEAEFIADLKIYARKNGGHAYSSSGGFTLPDSSVKSPDACYISAEKIAGFTREELRHFAAVVPDFVVEVVSPSDKLIEVHEKMQSVWIRNGVRLGWMVDVESEKLWIYRADGTVDLITPFEQVVTGEDVLPGFEFDLQVLF